MKKFITFFLIVFYAFCITTVNAQLSTRGIPKSFVLDDLSEFYQEVIIPSPDIVKLIEEDLKSDKFSLPRRFAQLLPVGLNLRNAGTWELLDDGSRIWRLKLRSKHALATSLYFDDFYLPKGAMLYLYDDSKQQVKGAFTEINNHKSRLFATELIFGDAVILELYLPGFVTNKPALQVSHLAYAYRDVPCYDSSKGFGSSDFCEININCSPEGDNWQDEKKGVVRIKVKVYGAEFWCSGSLVNNARFDLTPYILTADHCAFQYGHYASPEDLNQWIFYFNYESETCEDPPEEPEIYSLTGASKIANGGNHGTEGSDFYLVLLNDNVPDSYDPYYNGWSAIDSSSSFGVTIHHPEGDIKKISTYTTPLVTYDFSGTGLPSHWEVYWTETFNNWGVTEPGSSGSPLFDSDGKILGTLTAGWASCYSPDLADYYGKFSYHWQSNGTADTTRLKPWLDPDNTGITSINGTTLSVTELKIKPKDNIVKIYPNPADNFVYLNFINFEPSKIHPEISGLIDILGKPVKNLFFNKLSENNKINISDIQSGVYFIKIEYNQKIIIKKIIKR